MRSCEAVRRRTSFVAALILALVTTTSGQDSAPASPLTLVSRDARRAIPTSIQNGRDADLLLVDGNPLEDITATERISQIIYKGERINRSRLFDQE